MRRCANENFIGKTLRTEGSVVLAGNSSIISPGLPSNSITF
jgi:hypothetical protein